VFQPGTPMRGIVDFIDDAVLARRGGHTQGAK
jgi:hypothetical protein